MATTYSDLSSAVTTYIEKELLDREEYNYVFYDFAKKATIPKFNSKTIQFNRFKKLAIPKNTLTEGTTPSDTSLSLETVTATLDQWGMVVTLTDVAELTIHDQLFQDTIANLKDALNRLIEREILEVLLDGTNVQYAGGAIGRTAIGSTATIVASDEIGTVVKTLKRAGAPKVKGAYVGVVDPEVEEDITNSQQFREAHRFVETKALYDNYIGRWKGVDWVTSNLLPALDRIPNSDVTLADSSTSGSLSGGTAYDIVVARRDTTNYLMDGITQILNHTTGAGVTAIDVTVPNTTGYEYDVYIGTDGGTLYLFSSGNAPGSTVAVTNIDTTADTIEGAPDDTSHTKAIHTSFVFGKNAFACADLSGQGKAEAQAIRAYITPPTTDKGYATDSDPLKQRRKMGFKLVFKSLILNENWLVRIESVSDY